MSGELEENIKCIKVMNLGILVLFQTMVLPRTTGQKEERNI
jgi:hypothetical protein